MRPIVRVILAAALAISAIGASHAALVEWTLHDVMFNDGGTASGFFIVDTTTGQLHITPPDPERTLDQGGGFDIKTTTGPVLFGLEYFPDFAGGGFQDSGVDSHSFHETHGNVDFTAQMRLITDADLLHDTRGTFQVLPGPTTQCIDPFDTRCSEESVAADFLPACDVFSGTGCTAFRTVLLGGTVTATVVPELSSTIAVLVTFAVLGLRFVSRKLFQHQLPTSRTGSKSLTPDAGSKAAAAFPSEMSATC
jgi:hypothetical protein